MVSIDTIVEWKCVHVSGLLPHMATLARFSRGHIPECGLDDARLGFHPAFLDTATLSIHLSRYPDGRPAPFHLLDGLPNEVVVARSMFGRIIAVKATLVSGFERNGVFYTRSAAVRAAAQWITRG
jgi:hypothetical protein